MSFRYRSLCWELGIALVPLGFFLLLRLHVLDWVPPSDAPSLYFLMAVIVAAWNGGFRAGVLATLMSLGVIAHTFLPPYGSFAVSQPSHQLRLPLFLAAGFFVSWAAGAMKSFRLRAQASELAIQKREETWRNTLLSIGDGVITTDLEGRVVFANTVTEAFTGWKQADAQGRSLDDVLALVDEEGRHPVESPAAQALQQHAPVRSANRIILLGPDGTQRHVEIVAAPIVLGPSDQSTGVVLVIRDITQRRQAEVELRQLHRRKDEFLATLAHELRNPLAALQSGVQLIERLPNVPAELGDVQRIMDRQVRQLVRLIDDLLDVSRISRGKIQLRKKRVKLGAIVEAALETAGPFLAASGHAISVEQTREEVYVRADPARLTQAVVNLINNAAKFTPAPGRIWLTTERLGSTAVISVRDSGIGLAAEDLPRIFDLFGQVSLRPGQPNPGLGIGLALTRQLVELHGGKIVAESDGPGTGSRFTISLPAVAGPAAAPAATPTQAAPPLRVDSFRVLVVEDNEDTSQLLVKLLQCMGHEVEVARNGRSALDKLTSFEPQAVFSDISMPEMDGYEFAARLRERPECKDIHLIAMTGHGRPEDRQRAAQAGFDRHLVKPLTMSQLNAVFQFLAERGAQPTAAGR